MWAEYQNTLRDENMYRCEICNRVLKDKESIKRMIGPTCWRKIGGKEGRKMRNEQKVVIEEIPGQINLFEEDVYGLHKGS